MNASFLKSSTLCRLSVFTVVLFVPSLHPEETRTKPAVVQIDKTSQGVAYRVDSKPTGSTPTTDLLYALNQVHKRAASTVVIVIIDPHVPIAEIWNLDSVAAKAQLTNLRYFVFNRETGMMSELKWGRGMPFSTNPPAD